jgi:hypothetical protein
MKIPTRAVTQLKEYKKFEQVAKRKGEAWADDVPQVHQTEAMCLIAAEDAPATYREAMEHEDIWLTPMQSEYNDLVRLGVWELIPRPPDANVIGCKSAFANKYDDTGKIIKRKARLVAKGFHQIPGVDFFESHHSVVRFDSLRMLCAIAVVDDMEIGQIDIAKAYLNAELTETVLMDQPEGFFGPGEGEPRLQAHKGFVWNNASGEGMVVDI